MSCLKQFTLVAVLRLLGSLFQVLGPTYKRLCIPNLDLRKGPFYRIALIFLRASELVQKDRMLLID